MRDPTRIPRILAKLATAWEASPDLRLGQLVENIVWKEAKTRTLIINARQMGKTQMRQEYLAHPVFSVEDDRFETALDRWIAEPTRYFEVLKIPKP